MKQEKKKQTFKQNDIFGAEIDAKDHELNGIIERKKDISLFNELNDCLEGESFL